MTTPPAIFISYNHEQLPLVKNDLIPLLEAGGASIVVDFREFRAGELRPPAARR